MTAAQAPVAIAADPRNWLWRRRLIYLTNLLSFALFWRIVETDASGLAVQAVVGALALLLTAQNLAYIFAPSLEAGWSVMERVLPWVSRRGGNADEPR